MGYVGPPFAWDIDRRAIVRTELDAAAFKLFGIERDDAAHILDAFPIVSDRDISRYGEYRTKRLILERFDAIVTGTEYQTVLDPPPADPSCAHAESTRPPWAGTS